MGVHGLWQLLQSTGRPVNLESLEGKVLGVDVSMWLHQTMKGMRDRQGNPLPNAHLLGLYHRICKLLYYRIKPVFVFDGGVPVLKRQTLSTRRQRKEEAEETSSKTAKKLLSNLLKHKALSAVLGTAPGGDGPGTSEAANSVLQGAKSKAPDIFELKPLPETDRPFDDEPTADDSLDTSYEERMEQREIIYEQFQDLEEVNLESEEFLALPPEVKHEILSDLKEKRKRGSWSKIDSLPADSDNFSNYQMAKLMKQSKLSQKIEDVRKELNSQGSGDVVCSLTGDNQGNHQVEARRVISEDTSHYILIKGLSKSKEPVASQGTSGSKKADSQNEAVDTHDYWVEKRRREKEARQRLEMEEDAHGSPIKAERRDMTVTVVSSSDEDEISELKVKAGKDDVQSSSPGSIEVVKMEYTNAPQTANNVVNLIEDAVLEEINEIPGKSKVVSQREIHAVSPHGIKRHLSNEDTENEPERKTMRTLDTLIPCSPCQHKDSEKIIPEGHRIMQVPKNEVETSYPIKADKEVHVSPVKKSVSPTAYTDLSIHQGKKEREQTKLDATDNSLATMYDKHEGTVKVEESAKAQDLQKISVNVETGEQSGTDSDDDGSFIEVSFKPSDIKGDDELFPASIFTSAAEENANIEAKSVLKDVDEVQEGMLKTDDSGPLDMRPRASEPFPDIPNKLLDEHEFDGMSKDELADLQQVLEAESSQLLQERGRQERMATSITDQMQIEAQELLRLFGLPFVISPMEAEAQCAQLDLASLTEGTITDDSDIWLFGGQNVYKNVFNQKKHVEWFRAADIKSQLLLDRPKLINIALICGSDYTVGIQGAGPVTAMEVLGEFSGKGLEPLKKFRAWWEEAQKKVKVQETKIKSKLRHLEVREGFPNDAVVEAYMDPTVDKSEDSFSWGLPDLDLLRQFASEKFGWARSKTDESLLPVMKQLSCKETQRLLTSFFPTEMSEPRKIKSKRVKRILNVIRNPDVTKTATSPKTAVSTCQDLPSKGKSTRNWKPKNSGVRSQDCTSTAGGFVQKSNTLSQEVELSESSSSGSDEFADDIDDDVLMNIDLDSLQSSNQGSKTTGKPSHGLKSESTHKSTKVLKSGKTNTGIKMVLSDTSKNRSKRGGKTRPRGKSTRGRGTRTGLKPPQLSESDSD